MSFAEDIVGIEDLMLRAMFEELMFVVEKKSLFTIFPIGATIQDGGKRKRSKVDGWSAIFFLNHQFITRCVEADHGSYFHNYIHRTQTNRILIRKEKKKKMEKEKN